jgi:glycosyltransferase involved in cell wall biosynthesis
MGPPQSGHAGSLVTEPSPPRWPKISVILGGAQDSPGTRHTARSVAAGDYPGEIQLLTGGLGEPGSPAAIANAHAAEASGNMLMMLPPGATLDPPCLRRLVDRLLTDDRLAAVGPEWRGPDGARVASASYSSAPAEIRPLLDDLFGGDPADRLPLDLAPVGSMLTRTKQFFAIGGYNLDLDDTLYSGADFGRRLAESGGGVSVEAGAVAFVPHPPAGPYRLPAYGLASPLQEPMSPQRGARRRPHRVLWAAAHLPDRDRSGIDARQFEMIESLARSGAEVLVWAEHDSGTHPVGRELTAAGVRWIAPPPDRRWDLRHQPGSGTWLRDLLGGVDWDSVVIGEPRLAGWIAPQVRAVAPQARTVVDLGTVRFTDAYDSEVDTADPADILPGIADIDAVVAANAADATVLERAFPGLPAFVFGALGRHSTGAASADGGLLFIGDLFHRPNLLALEWWMDDIAARVEARLGYAVPLRVVGHGSEAHRAVWDHPSKVDIAGWQPDFSSELSRARLLVVPLTMLTGTGGRIASALAQGVPVVASSPAVAALSASLVDLVHQGKDAATLADTIALLMSDDSAWEAAHRRIASVDIGALRESRTASLAEWLDGIPPSTGGPVVAVPTRTPRTRPAPRRQHRAS